MFKVFAVKLNDSISDILLDKVSFLSLEEKEKCLRYKFKKDRALSAAGRLMFQRFCTCFEKDEYSAYNLITDFDDFNEDNINFVTVDYEENGKGYVKDTNDLYFNISHSGDYCVLVLSDKEVGIDIQEVRKINENIAVKYFDKKDNEYIFEKTDEKTNRFIKVWCAKESFAKLTGRGFSEGLGSFYEDFSEMEIRDSKNDRLKAKLHEICVEEGYFCFVSEYLNE